MSWISRLLDTYNNCADEIGVGADNPDSVVLLPISHTTNMAHVEICISIDGEFIHGSSRVLVDKRDQLTIIPCSEDSANRTSGLCPHPLFDKLQYIAGDYCQYGGEKKKWDYKSYISNLEDWCASSFAVPSVCSALTYLRKGNLISDLISDGILQCDDHGKVIVKKPEGVSDVPLIFKAIVSDGNPLDAFIRFRVQVPGKTNDRIWLDKEVWNSFINYYTGTLVEKGICYVDGNDSFISEKSPSKIRNSGDKAKLISSNDQDGFTYRGRFTSADQAVTIGYVSSQKVHNVLKWLIARQGAKIGQDQYYLAWGTNDEHVPSLCVDSDDLGILNYNLTVSSTQEEFAATLKKALAGYCSNLSDNSKIMIIGLDSATKGCLSIVYYKEYSGSVFIDNIVFWHSTCRWIMHKTVKEADGKKFRHYSFIGAPRPEEIVKAAYGESASDTLLESEIKRLIPCISEKSPVPKDIVSCLVHRASSPVSMENWEYNRVLAIACAVIKKSLNDQLNKSSKESIRDYKEKWKMALDKQSTDRSYLFGRLLAYAQNVESYSMFVSGDTPRQTNAERMMHQFALKPARTWRIVFDQLVYYFKKIGAGGLTAKLQREMAGIIDQIGDDGFDDRKLDDEYLLGYSSQMIEFEKEKAKAKEEKENN